MIGVGIEPISCWDTTPPIGDGGGGGVSFLPGNVASDYFMALGATQPWYAGSTQYNACFHNGKTYVTWEAYDAVCDKRFTKIRAYTHATGTWGLVYTVGPWSAVEDDDHGVPAIAVNADGRVSVAWGNHDGNFHFATMTNVGDESHWTVIASGLAGRYTYPHLVLVGTTMYVLVRVDVAPGAEFSAGAKYLAYRPVTYSGATATIGAQVKIADFGNDSRWYQGNALARSGRIAQVCARADYNDTFRRDVYYYEVDFVNARLQSFNGATANFPVNRTTMDSTFRVRQTTAPAELGVPSWELADDGKTHIIFAEGTTTPTIYHIVGEAGVFAAPVAVFTNPNASTLADGPRIVKESGSRLGMYYPTDPSNLYTRGGVATRRIYSGGSWGSPETVMSPDGSRFPLGQLGVVFNAHADARVIFCEASESDSDATAFPGKRGFVLGDNGFLPKPRLTATAPVAWSGEGAWYDPSDLSSMWQDRARTIPAAVGSVVQAIDDKSGNNHHLILAASVTEAGILRNDDGVYWIDIGDEFSPTTYYELANLTLVVSNAYWVTGGYRDWNNNSGSTTHNLINLDEGTGADRVFSIARANNSSNGEGQLNLTPFSNAGAGASFSSTTGGVRASDDFTFGLHVNGTAATGYLNGSQYGTATVATVPDTGASRLRLGTNASAGSTTFLQGRFYGLIIRGGNIDLTTRQADMAYIQSKMPL